MIFHCLDRKPCCGAFSKPCLADRDLAMSRWPHTALLFIALLAPAGCGDGGSTAVVTPPQPVPIPDDASEGLRAALTRLNDPDPLERALGARRLAQLGEDPGTLVPFLLTALGDPNLVVRTRAAESLGEIGDPAAVAPLIERLGDRAEVRDVRTRAAEALGRLGSPAAVPALLDVLDDPVWHIRYHAIVALGAIGDPAAQDGLANAVRYDPDQFNRETAQRSLQRVSGGQSASAES
jgi:HEAT repeat protein